MPGILLSFEGKSKRESRRNRRNEVREEILGRTDSKCRTVGGDGEAVGGRVGTGAEEGELGFKLTYGLGK